MQEFNINSKSVAHMIAQIRAKQLAIRDSQYEVQKSIVAWEEHQNDINIQDAQKKIIDDLEKFYNTSKSINNYLKKQNVKVEDIGFPIKYNKTDLQLKMAYEYAKEKKDNLIEQIKNGKFYHGLSNSVNSEELPILQSNNKTSYWGNENSSVSSALLAVTNISLGNTDVNMPGAATFYPFYNPEYTLPEGLLSQDYFPNANKNILLFGDYQFGGARYLKHQSVFSPEDCSSAIGKATGLTTEQVKSISTREIRENYSKYGYKLITTLNNINQKQLELINPGDIYLCKTHTAIIATKPDNFSNITTLQFARDIDRENNKILGGGLYDYNLIENLKKDALNPIHILRAKNLEPLHEEISLQGFLNKIDEKYDELALGDHTKEVVGDCSVFLENLG